MRRDGCSAWTHALIVHEYHDRLIVAVSANALSCARKYIVQIRWIRNGALRVVLIWTRIVIVMDSVVWCLNPLLRRRHPSLHPNPQLPNRQFWGAIRAVPCSINVRRLRLILTNDLDARHTRRVGCLTHQIEHRNSSIVAVSANVARCAWKNIMLINLGSGA